VLLCVALLALQYIKIFVKQGRPVRIQKKKVMVIVLSLVTVFVQHIRMIELLSFRLVVFFLESDIDCVAHTPRIA